jgi:phosphotransacetylase
MNNAQINAMVQKIKAYSETHADCIRKGGAVIAFMCNKKRKPMEEINDNSPVKSKRKRIVEDEGVTPRKFKKVSMLSCRKEIKAAEIVFKEKYEKIEENLEKKYEDERKQLETKHEEEYENERKQLEARHGVAIDSLAAQNEKMMRMFNMF